MLPRRSEARSRDFERRLKGRRTSPKYVLRLYVTGATPRSTRAVLNLKNLCEKHLPGGYSLEVVDVYQQPSRAREEQIICSPTLVKYLPLPLRRFIGDLSNTEKILLGLDLQAQPHERENSNGSSAEEKPGR
jgi:circadian clock protein KaiB